MAQTKRKLPAAETAPKVSLSGGGDAGAPQRHLHGKLAKEGAEGTGEQHYRDLEQTNLDRYFERQLLGGKLESGAPDIEKNKLFYDAGVRLGRDWYLAGIDPKMTINLVAGRGGGRGDWNDNQIAARVKYQHAVRSVGLMLSPVMLHVCCMDGSASEWAAHAMRLGREASKSVGIALLRLALEALADHYQKRS